MFSEYFALLDTYSSLVEQYWPYGSALLAFLLMTIALAQIPVRRKLRRCEIQLDRIAEQIKRLERMESRRTLLSLKGANTAASEVVPIVPELSELDSNLSILQQAGPSAITPT
jgi:hypothetical protein